MRENEQGHIVGCVKAWDTVMGLAPDGHCAQFFFFFLIRNDKITSAGGQRKRYS